jgi:hypothetical protein
MERFDIWMIFAVAKNLGDDAALFGDAQALVRAQLFDVDLAMHGPELRPQAA